MGPRRAFTELRPGSSGREATKAAPGHWKNPVPCSYSWWTADGSGKSHRAALRALAWKEGFQENLQPVVQPKGRSPQSVINYLDFQRNYKDQTNRYSQVLVSGLFLVKAYGLSWCSFHKAVSRLSQAIFGAPWVVGFGALCVMSRWTHTILLCRVTTIHTSATCTVAFFAKSPVCCKGLEQCSAYTKISISVFLKWLMKCYTSLGILAKRLTAFPVISLLLSRGCRLVLGWASGPCADVKQEGTSADVPRSIFLLAYMTTERVCLLNQQVS